MEDRIMIIGNFTDLHARADTPQGRTDNFRKSILTKLEEIGQIWKDNKVEIVTFTGDLFDSPDPASSVRNDVISILKSWRLRIVGVVGSHDYFGYQMKTLKRTALGSLYYAGIIDLVGGADQKEYVEFRLKDFTAVITGTPHTYWATDNLLYIEKPRYVEGAFQIQLVHFDLMNKTVPWPHLTIGQIRTSSDVAFCGHYHPGWEVPVMGKDHCLFINQGSIGRLDNTGKQRTPRVCILQLTDSFSPPDITYVSLQSALQHPFKEYIKESKEIKSQDISKLLQMMENTDINIIDIKTVLPKVAKEFNFGEDVLSKAFELLEKV
jgi:DNA repair exonuclease SbcCD nuclease subunit